MFIAMDANATAWDRLIRYVSAKDGSVRWGEPIIAADDLKPDIDGLALKGGLKVRVLKGETPFAAKPTGEEDEVRTLLGPLATKDVPSIRCIGLNYRAHILETGLDLPVNPTVFMKPPTCVADTRAPTPIPSFAQSSCDYEGELAIVIGRDCKNATPDTALSYVAGYAVANDVSCRLWQMDKDKAGSPPQWSFSKSFDKYAPLGPAIVSTKLLGDASGLRLTTKVNGEVRQDSNTKDLCFGVKQLVAFCSMGQTLLAGTLILTGTPGGVGFVSKPPKYLKDGDEVEVEIEGVGKVVTKMGFE